ncbi:alpha/beta fold hydrolase [Gordonia insulae]|uniref:4,5:9,10-diseco-3-hydroxy-5,9, 17-trioxoandrosta-1(10),2-diene-4-oate hydrolase n=1 Tax=Gordonia insulae TaxID=2420509 RepID=A0A3G8JLF0_9ACTN|nr:alpha/beta fold hydrolase [Gordonia insulae]AZG45911.1 4,5:9,10-diseco-3-hydroxy-5,9,17-trioxoandrosta-1(10),2-diene-4-oate hydrolase [Gordonia insulae]
MSAVLTHDATRRTLDTDKGVLHYHEAGDGPPLLLLHGSGPGVSGWSNYQGNLPAFAEHFRTLILDFPGFGKSYSCDENPMLTALPSVLDFLDGMGLGEVAVVGNSMGGNVASRLAATHSDRVKRLVTIGGIGTPVFSASPPEGIKLLVQFVDDPTRENLMAWMESMVYDPALLTGEFVESRWQTASDPAALADVRRLFNAGSLAGMRVRNGAAVVNQIETLTKIAAPTLLTWGRDDRVTPLDSSLMPMRLIPNCELHVFHNCGHWAMIERKDEFEKTVIPYLLRDVRG